MVNILLEGYGIHAPWLRRELKRYLCGTMRATVIPFSFRDSRIRNAEDWDRSFGEEGNIRKGILMGFSAYGIPEENVTFVDYFRDTTESALEKVGGADILYFTGGLPDKMTERLAEFDLTDTLRRHRGVVMGYSAGALIQFDEYHLSPDHDYPQFGYYRGLGYLSGFGLEVHYKATEVQNASIRRVIAERARPVYATHLMQGALVAEDGIPRPIGKVTLFG